MSNEKMQKLMGLSNRGHSVLAAISKEIDSQAILGFAELIGKALTLDFDPVEREILWQAGGVLKRNLPDPIARVLEQYVGWFMDCTLLFTELGWNSVPRVQNFISARTELTGELQRRRPSLQVVLKIVEHQVRLLENLHAKPPLEEPRKGEEDSSESSSAKRGLAILLYVLICTIADILLVFLLPLELIMWIVGSELAVLSVTLGIWKFLKGEE